MRREAASSSKLGRAQEAREAYTTALKTATLEPERRFLAARIARIW